MDPIPDDEADTHHSLEPWRQDGRYIRDASGAIVVRGRSFADARRIVAAINATRDIPTDALEQWLVQDVSDPSSRPDLEVAITEEPEASPFAVSPPDAPPDTGPLLREEEPRPWPYTLTSPDRRRTDRRLGERRSPRTEAAAGLIFDRRVMDRRFGNRRER